MRWMWPLVWEPGKILSLVHFLICPQSQLPTLIKSTRHPDLLTHHLYFWSPPLRNALLSLSPSVSPLKLHLHSLYHPLPCCYRQLPVDFISYGSLPNFMAPTLWFTLYGSTSYTRLLIVLVSFPVALIKYPRQELGKKGFILLIILNYSPWLWENQGSKNLKYIVKSSQRMKACTLPRAQLTLSYSLGPGPSPLKWYHSFRI